MPPTATLQDIKAHQDRIEKNQITPDRLPPCPRCGIASALFRLHAYRERKFLIIIEMLVQAVACTLARFRCPGCGKTFTHYPAFALPYKRYSQPTIEGFCARYLESDPMTYQQAAQIEGSVPGYPDGEATLAASTIHRWVTTLGGLTRTCRAALELLLAKEPASSICRDLAQLTVPARKYRSEQRKTLLVRCRQLLLTHRRFKQVFQVGLFTKLATDCAFT